MRETEETMRDLEGDRVVVYNYEMFGTNMSLG
jgi:hypothetical protein